MDKETETKVKSLMLRGFSKDEIAKTFKIDIIEINKLPEVTDLKINSESLYTDLQKDLAKLVYTEINKENRDNNVILNSIKLQAELQEKKLVLARNIPETKVNKDYIYTRDKEIFQDLQDGLSQEEVAKKFNISKLSIKLAIDRYGLNLPEELQTLNPSIISETIGLDKNTRLKLLREAYNNNYTRKTIRNMVNKIKNKQR